MGYQRQEVCSDLAPLHPQRSTLNPQRSTLNPQRPMYGTLREYTPQNDALVISLVLGCFLTLMLVIGHQRVFIGKLSRRYFLPTNKEDKMGQKTPGERSLPYLASIVLACSSGLMLFSYVCKVYDLEKSPYYIWSVLLLCLGAFFGYYLIRWLLYSFINWVFFERRLRRQWMMGFGLSMVYESALFFLLLCCAMFYNIPLHLTGIIIAICYGIMRFAFIPGTKRIFFPEFYGILHLFAYLCTLEILPLLALWKFCTYWGCNLIVR